MVTLYRGAAMGATGWRILLARGTLRAKPPSGFFSRLVTDKRE
jgi:hypothetical protein